MDDRTRRRLGIAVAILLAVIGTIGLVAYVNSAKDDAVAGENPTKVLVATTDIDAGTPVGELGTKTKVEEVPAKVVAAGAITSLTDVRNTVTAVPMVAGEQLIASRFVSAGSEVAASGGVVAPKGFLETTVSLEPARALGGLIRPGQRVAVVASFTDTGQVQQTRTVLGDVLVTNVQVTGTASGSSDSTADAVATSPQAKLLVTMAVAPADLEKFVNAAEGGKVWLATVPT